jgi:uncharacterized protein YbjT (DUF2867 family)
MLREEAEHGTRHQRAVGPSVSGTAGMGKPCMARFVNTLSRPMDDSLNTEQNMHMSMKATKEVSMTKVLVTGGAGMLSREVVKQLTETGYNVRIMSRKQRPPNLLSTTEWARADLETGQGIADAVADIDVVVHAASSPFKHTRRIDVDGTRLLLEQVRLASVARVIYISIVGIDRISYDYYRAKLAAEELVKNSGIPWSLLRATQFHYLVDLFFQTATKVPWVTLLPTDLQCQSIDESEVASRVSEIVIAGPHGRLADLGGPEVLTAGEMVQSWLNLRRMHHCVLPLHVPGKVAQGFRRGYNTCPDQASAWAHHLVRMAAKST